MATPRPFGVYVHVPFCTHRCDYCAFATWTDRMHLVDDYVAAVVTHLDRARATGDLVPATSVFFGGGTPSLLDPDQLASILRAVPRDPGAEVTVECNPDTVDRAKLDGYAAAGVNRLSFGVQSMVDHVLAALGRTHDPANVTSAVAAARAAGFTEINLDLIYGAAGESVDDWEQTLDAALALAPTHVSAYGLTVEAGTPLADDPARHPDDDDQATKYEVADRTLTGAGLANYEISNWARPGSACRHNQLYWAQGDYLGVGCAAHSHVDGRRFWTVRTPDRYLEMVGRGEEPVAGEERLDAEGRRIEAAQLALRTASGAPADAFGPDGPPEEIAHLLARHGDRLVLTPEGRLLANEVAIRLR